MSANIKTWKERRKLDSGLHDETHMEDEIADLRAALAAAAAPAVAKECFMCHGTGQHAIPLAIPAGIEPPPERMMECQQCKPAPQQVAASERERFEAWCAGKLLVKMHGGLHAGLYASHDTRMAWGIWQARAALGPPAIPGGWQIVPKEPTEVMIQAACLSQCAEIFETYDEWWDSHSSGVSRAIREIEESCYRAMLAAAPAPGDAP